MRIGSVTIPSPFAVAPMAGMTDTAFRRLVKRHGGCGLVVTEMVSSEGLVRGIDRTLEYAEYTEEERPVSIQIFGGEPGKMAAAAQVVQDMGADIVDVNMGCPVPKIAKHNAGCRLMREPKHAAAVIRAMVRAVKIPVTVKMRAGWDDSSRNAPELAQRVEEAGASAIAIHGRTAAQSYRGLADWDLVGRVAVGLTIPVLGSGDCVEPDQVVGRMRSGVSGVLAQASDIAAGDQPRRITMRERGRFLHDYVDLLLSQRVNEADGFRHMAPGRARPPAGPAPGHARWIVNKVRALCAWYSKGLDCGGQLRVRVNSAQSLDELRDIIDGFFLAGPIPEDARLADPRLSAA